MLNIIITQNHPTNLVHHDYYHLPMLVETLAEPILLHYAELLSWWSQFQFCTGSHQSRHKRQNANMVLFLKAKSGNMLSAKTWA